MAQNPNRNPLALGRVVSFPPPPTGARRGGSHESRQGARARATATRGRMRGRAPAGVTAVATAAAAVAVEGRESARPPQGRLANAAATSGLGGSRGRGLMRAPAEAGGGRS